MLYIVHFTAFCLGGPFFSGHGVELCLICVNEISSLIMFTVCATVDIVLYYVRSSYELLQESPAVTDKSVGRESLPKIAPIRRAYNVVADNTALSSIAVGATGIVAH